MISKRIQEKGILAKLLEKGINILLKKECKKIDKIKIDILASSFQIIKGIIQKIHIIGSGINYKDLLFDEIELEANDVKIRYKINNTEFNFINNFIVNFKISLSENSLKTVLLSNNWNWICDIISDGVLNHCKLSDIEIKDDKILIKTSEDNQIINKEEKIDIKAKNGTIYLQNKASKKSIKIPIEDKIYIENVNIQKNLINIFANSSISF